MAAPAKIQDNVSGGSPQILSVSTTAQSLTAFGSNITAGSTVLIAVLRNHTSLRTYSVSDDGFATSYSRVLGATSGRGIEFHYKENHPGGAITLQIKQATGTAQACGIIAVEIGASLYDGTAVAFIGAIANVATNSGYACAPSGSLDTANSDVFVLAGCVTNGTTTYNGPTAGGWSQLAATTTYYYQCLESSAALVDDRAIIPETGTDRAHGSGMIAFYTVGGGSTAVPVFYTHMQQQRMA